MNSRLLTVVLVAALGVAFQGNQGAAQKNGGEVQKEADAKTQYAAASLLRKQIRGKKGTERRQAQMKAAAAYEAVAHYFSEEAPLAGRALYKAAELHEYLRDRENGVRCLKQIFKMHAESNTKAKAHNLLGHIYRRARNFKEAIKEYDLCIQDFPKEKAQVAVAMIWLGKCKATSGDHKGARETWQKRLEQFADRSRLVIESYDLIACSYLREGKTEKARETLTRCQDQFKAAAQDSGPEGQRIRKWLGKMKVVKRLMGSTEKRDDS